MESAAYSAAAPSTNHTGGTASSHAIAAFHALIIARVPGSSRSAASSTGAAAAARRSASRARPGARAATARRTRRRSRARTRAPRSHGHPAARRPVATRAARILAHGAPVVCLALAVALLRVAAPIGHGHVRRDEPVEDGDRAGHAERADDDGDRGIHG